MVEYQINPLEKIQQKDNFIEVPLLRFDTLNYRDQIIDFYENAEISQISAVWNGIKVDLEVNNRSNYIETIKQIIDYKLDTIVEFEVCSQPARLEFFNNGSHRDIRLIYKNRILKVYLIHDQSQLNFEKLQADAIYAITNIQDLL